LTSRPSFSSLYYREKNSFQVNPRPKMSLATVRPQMAASACPRVLFLPELLEHIAEMLRIEDQQESVLNLALTCKTMRNSPLSVLWKKMYGLHDLLKTLPPDCWRVRERSDETEVLELLPQAYREARSERFQIYARYIKHIVWRPLEDSEISLRSLYRFIHKARAQNLTLLPAVRFIHWSSERERLAALPYMLTVPGPFLRRFSITHWADDFSESIDALLKQCCALTTLRLRANLKTPADSLFNTLDESTIERLNLHYFSTTLCLTWKVIRTLASMPHLKSATFRTTAQLLETMTFEGDWFPALERLNIHLDVLSNSTSAFLGSIRSPALRSVHIFLMGHPSSGILSSHLQVLARHALREFLLRVTWQDTGRRYVESLITTDSLQHLFTISTLEVIRFDMDDFEVSHDMVDAVIKKIPGIKHLKFMSAGVPSSPPTLVTLAQLATSCPALEKIEMPIDTRLIPDLPAGFHSTSPVVRLDLGPADSIHPATGVSAYLRRLFPSLKYFDLDADCNIEEEPQRTWEIEMHNLGTLRDSDSQVVEQKMKKREEEDDWGHEDEEEKEREQDEERY